MKLSEIVAKITGLETRISQTDKVEFDSLKSTVASQLTQLDADLTTARQTIASLTTKNEDLSKPNPQIAQLTSDLATARQESAGMVANLRTYMATIDKAYAAGGQHADANGPTLLEAVKNAVNVGLAKTQVDIKTLPAAPAINGTLPLNGGRKMTLDQEIAARKRGATAAVN